MMVQVNWQKDARKTIYDAMSRVVFKNAYSAFGAALRLDFDPFGFSECQGRELCQAFGLNRALMLILISHFLHFFPNFVWPFLQCFQRVLDLYGLCVHKGMN